jgi:hypothetical protein
MLSTVFLVALRSAWFRGSRSKNTRQICQIIRISAARRIKVVLLTGPYTGISAVRTIGLDIAKSGFQVHGVEADGQVVFRRQLKRRYVLAFFQKVPSCLVGWRPARHRIIGRANCRRLGIRCG